MFCVRKGTIKPGRAAVRFINKSATPMEDIDKQDTSNATLDDETMMRNVINDDADLFYLDCFLSEILRKG